MQLSFPALSVLNFLVRKIEQDQVVPEEVCAREDLSSVHHELVESGLVIKDDALAGDPTFYVPPKSRTQVRIFAKKYRQAAIQLEIMGKIAENPDYGSTNDYYPTTTVRGETVTEAEYQRALAHLTGLELIKGIKAWQSGLIRPELTPNGYTTLESGYPPHVPVVSGAVHLADIQGGGQPSVFHNITNYTMNNAGPVGAVQQGDYNTASVTQHVGLDAESFAIAIQGIRESLHRANLDVEDLEDAEVLLETIEEEVAAGKPTKRISGFFRSFNKALPAALAAEVSGFVAQALSALPA